MTPIELHYRYKALRVPLDEHRTLDGLAVSRYLNPRPGSSTSSVIEEES
ncbi:MAG: hypothetical protein MZV70_19510 [Desulfobacterales bacterium]|nr:hypothetical protein [Desulfobacterales bacterium]